ncbi:unnamed protein product [Blepharisma stoltei]|uniref:Uncharacterized protein n=1 Tax=Blepharisma stoltei TaxID=1481888 RepID=A0AAU9JN87_9CILI|nr:unnamed protein product [Blepharisma stoltei]
MEKYPSSPYKSFCNFSEIPESKLQLYKTEIGKTLDSLENEYQNFHRRALSGSCKENPRLRWELNKLLAENKEKAERIKKLKNKIKSLKKSNSIFVIDHENEQEKKQIEDLNKKIINIDKASQDEEEKSLMYERMINKTQKKLKIFQEKAHNSICEYKDANLKLEECSRLKHFSLFELKKVNDEIKELSEKHHEKTRKFNNAYEIKLNLRDSVRNHIQQAVMAITHAEIQKLETSKHYDHYLFQLLGEEQDHKSRANKSSKIKEDMQNFSTQFSVILKILKERWNSSLNINEGVTDIIIKNISEFMTHISSEDNMLKEQYFSLIKTQQQKEKECEEMQHELKLLKIPKNKREFVEEPNIKVSMDAEKVENYDNLCILMYYKTIDIFIGLINVLKRIQGMSKDIYVDENINRLQIALQKLNKGFFKGEQNGAGKQLLSIRTPKTPVLTISHESLFLQSDDIFQYTALSKKQIKNYFSDFASQTKFLSLFEQCKIVKLVCDNKMLESFLSRFKVADFSSLIAESHYILQKYFLKCVELGRNLIEIISNRQEKTEDQDELLKAQMTLSPEISDSTKDTVSRDISKVGNTIMRMRRMSQSYRVIPKMDKDERTTDISTPGSKRSKHTSSMSMSIKPKTPQTAFSPMTPRSLQKKIISIKQTEKSIQNNKKLSGEISPKTPVSSKSFTSKTKNFN